VLRFCIFHLPILLILLHLRKGYYGHSMNSEHFADYGATVTRVGLGLVLIAHSVYLKLVVFSLPGTAQFFASIGLPATLAYIVFAIEAVAGVALVIGWRSRIAALAVVPVLLGATWAHASAGWLFTNSGGGWEYPALLSVLAIAQVFLGDGAFALANRRHTSFGGRHERADSAA
jgi:putative oxidoreductase